MTPRLNVGSILTCLLASVAAISCGSGSEAPPSRVDPPPPTVASVPLAVEASSFANRSVITWPASYPAALIRDRASRDVLAIGAGGAVVIAPTLRELEVEVSDGLRSWTVTVHP